ncbi:glycosyltransferase family 4 protein [Brachybacterium fresconis]|uniref:Glycosyltransferase involved in cell wall biosynthesis n=1 Tax=Brachybacterium fresconis TaxID=173363 RepID=A0ABS4YMB8_9MICO|nr:glycosyltransferase family 4 protein [Brachybacterium fresconis]MBP2409929.1 glycosyltransferase involved in cell wall biosynthesis [Brachybacterium fresconis]
MSTAEMSPEGKTILVVHPGAELFGSDRMLLESVIGFREAGCAVVVALPSDGPLVPELQRAGARVTIVPMLVLRKALLRPRGWPTLLRSSLTGLVSAWRLLGQVRPDAVYVSTIIIPQWPLLARARKTRSISHVHEAEAAGNRFVNAALYLPHLASTRTLVNSEFSLATIRDALVPLARRAEVIYNGVTSPEDPQPPRAELTGPLRILYLGRLSPRKGPDLVLDAASRLQDAGRSVAVTLLGTAFEGYEWYEEQLREQAASSGVEVAFAGFHSDIWPFLAEADVLVVPSRGDESFGNTAVEGVLSLRPVIVSDYSGLREAASRYDTTRLVIPDDYAAIAAELESLSTMWPQVAREVHSNRVVALRRHAPEVYRRDVTAAVTERLRTAPMLAIG